MVGGGVHVGVDQVESVGIATIKPVSSTVLTSSGTTDSNWYKKLRGSHTDWLLGATTTRRDSLECRVCRLRTPST